MGRKLVFAGPSLRRDDKTTSGDLVFLPPAVQGSFFRAVEHYAPKAILLVDGGFEGVAAVRHKEILWTISQGIPVLGSASMGALRAAELSPWMQGVGLIFRWYRRFDLAPDDAVAVQHGPQEIDFAPVTEALIDLRMTIRAAHRRKLVTGLQARALAAAAHRLHFRERTLAQVVATGMPGHDVSEMLHCLSQCLVHQKRVDALQALAILRSDAQHSAKPVSGLPTTRVFVEERAFALRS